MVRRRTLLTAAGGALLGSALATGTARADSSITVTPGTSYGSWEGWGTSLAWWANVFGDRDDFADIFFTTKSVTYNGKSLPGLGLNIARYNLGGCSWNTYNGSSMVASANIPAVQADRGLLARLGERGPHHLLVGTGLLSSHVTIREHRWTVCAARRLRYDPADAQLSRA